MINDREKNGLEVVFAVGGETITVGGEQIEIKEATIGKAARVFKNLGSILAVVNADAKYIKQDGSLNFSLLLIDHPDDVLSAVAALAGKSRAWVDDLPPDDAVLLASRIFEVNADLFMRRLPKTLQEEAERIKQAVERAQAGAGSSSA